MTPIVAALVLLVGLAILIAGADALVIGAAQLARRLGLSAFAVGVTVVAFGTSAPELFASIGAALQGIPGLAIGNVMGSNIANIALILGIGTLVTTIHIDQRVRRVEIPLMVAISLVASALLIDGVVARVEGALLVAALIGYVVYIIRSHKEDIVHEAEDIDAHPKPVWKDLLMIALGIAGLGIGARLLVLGAEDLATGVGVPEAIVGTTIVAFGTSVPELVTTVRAAMSKQADMAVGNIVGSNIFNLLSVLGITAVIKALGVDDSMTMHLAVMIGVSVALMLWAFVTPKLGRLFGVLALVVYLVYVLVSYLPSSLG